MPDTLEDRCLVIRMQRKTPGEQCERLKSLESAPVSTLRRKCARFVLDHAAEIARARPALPASLNDRAADIAEPLLVLADLAGVEWSAAARQAVGGLTAKAQENNPIWIVAPWTSGLCSWKSEVGVFHRTLVSELNRRADRPWAFMRKGKEITDAWLADQFASVRDSR